MCLVLLIVPGIWEPSWEDQSNKILRFFKCRVKLTGVLDGNLWLSYIYDLV